MLMLTALPTTEPFCIRTEVNDTAGNLYKATVSNGAVRYVVYSWVAQGREIISKPPAPWYSSQPVPGFIESFPDAPLVVSPSFWQVLAEAWIQHFDIDYDDDEWAD